MKLYLGEHGLPCRVGVGPWGSVACADSVYSLFARLLFAIVGYGAVQLSLLLRVGEIASSTIERSNRT